jgi:hypothetical protein
MDANMKLLIEDMLKQVRDEIKEVREEIESEFTVHFDSIDQRFTKLSVDEKARDERIATLEAAAAAFDNSFATWKPKVDASLGSVKLELSKLNTYFDRDAKGASTSKSSMLQFRLASEQPPAGSTADGPNGHHVDQHYRDCGFDSVYTLTHDPIKGMMPSPSFTIDPVPNSMFTPCREPFRSASASSQGPRNWAGKLPKLNFPSFDGDNLKLWKSWCENYFEMYEIESSMWVIVAAMHFEGPAAQWLQSMDHQVCIATLTELCSWIHVRFGRDQHELLI